MKQYNFTITTVFDVVRTVGCMLITVFTVRVGEKGTSAMALPQLNLKGGKAITVSRIKIMCMS